jgi:hypothetical protein
LDAHVKVCETARRKAATKQRLHEESLGQPFYAHDINSGGKQEDQQVVSSNEIDLDYGPDALAWLRAARSSKDRLLGVVLPLVSLSKPIAATPIESDVVPSEDLALAPSEETNSLVSNDDSTEGRETLGTRTERALKHHLQELAMVAHLREIDLIKPDITYVEFGAGSGGLGWAVRKAAAPANPPVVLIEKSEFPARTDRQWLEPRGDGDGMFSQKHQTMKSNGEAPSFYRARIDIRHLESRRLPFIAGQQVCAIAKHLCGVATDLTIAVILGQLHENRLQNRFAGSAIVTCCHGLIQWDDYPEAGKRWLAKNCNAGREQFEMMKQCSGWAVDGGAAACHCKRDRNREEHLRELRERAAEETAAGTPGPAVAKLNVEEDFIRASISARKWRSDLPEDERVAIGQSCKRLLDAGRREAFREAGLQCEIVRFIGEEITPENTLLLAWSNPLLQPQLA